MTIDEAACVAIVDGTFYATHDTTHRAHFVATGAAMGAAASRVVEHGVRRDVDRSLDRTRRGMPASRGPVSSNLGRSINLM